MSIEKYLANYSEPETGHSSLITTPYQYVLCIPAFAERLSFIDKLKRLPSIESVLVVLVVNAPDQINNAAMYEQTTALLEHCNSQSIIRSTEGATLLELAAEPQRDLLLVDRCSADRLIPHRQGVGLARKIAADIALDLIATDRVSSSWLYFSDADVTIPSGYFAAGNDINTESASTLIYPFRHTSHEDPKVRLGQNLYDFSLYYYEQGLKNANSPYAWQSLGSTLAVSARHYAQVRGVPRRNAGEDFHLINKLSKTGRVIQLDSPVLEIETRLSSRVPYGTGPALNNLITGDNPAGNIEIYAPDTFKMLKLTLKGLNASYPHIKAGRLSDLSVLFHEWCSRSYSERIVTVLEKLGTAEALKRAAKNSTEESSYLNHVSHWFDALKTLRFIHLMRDHYYPSQPIIDLKQDALFQSTLDLMGKKGMDINLL